jgi:uncharacterized protein (DUF58 family)
MSPTSRLLVLVFVWLLLAIVAVAQPWLMVPWLILGASMAAVAAIDAVLTALQNSLVIERVLPGRFAIGEVGEVKLLFKNRSDRALKIELFDGIPSSALSSALPLSCEIPAAREFKVFYPVILNIRGGAVFGKLHLRLFSPLSLWVKRSLYLKEETVKVYPNYEPVIRFALLAMQHRESPLGIVRRARAGASQDFQQLRDYRDGDPLARIDWKASSRRQVLISRDYQEQQNQSIVFLLDTGRRMRAMDCGVPQFEQVLNAILLTAHVALRQGDQVAVKSFGGSDRWLPPIKGAHAMPVLLNHLYDYQTTLAPSDFSLAVERLMARQRRRSLVILLTNLRGEDGKELVPALQVLKTRHLVLLASMRERVVDDMAVNPVNSFASALKFLAADRYMQERREILANLGARGILTLDSTAQQFAVALANSYFDIKAAGRL